LGAPSQPGAHARRGTSVLGANNVNGIGINSIVDYQVLPLDSKIEEIQEAYIRSQTVGKS
jgi:hypothetical protein